jgi:hypothetical protein
LALVLFLAACDKPAPPAAPALGLDCSQDFAGQSQRIVGQAGLVAAPKDPAEPYRFYSSADGKVSYLITEPGAPGHPAILMQTSGNGTEKTTGCPYGDPKGYAQVLAYIESLRAVTHK